MGYHSEDGRYFLGWRRTVRGQLEVIFDSVGGGRQVFEIAVPPQSRPERLGEALQAALRSRNVTAALRSQLHARGIAVACEHVRM